MTEYRVNLTAAKAAPHSEYMFRLLLALNDVLSARQLGELIDGIVDVPKRDGLSAYSIRLLQAHLVEVRIAFFEMVRPIGKPSKPQHPVYEFISANNDRQKLFDELESLLNTDGFKGIRKLRNTFVFHYNYRDDGAGTQRAVDALLVRCQDCPSGRENLIIYTGDPLTSRFLIADELVNAGWKLFVGLPQCFEDSHPDHEKYMKFVGQLLLAFIRFAQGMILSWSGENQLQG